MKAKKSMRRRSLRRSVRRSSRRRSLRRSVRRSSRRRSVRRVRRSSHRRSLRRSIQRSSRRRSVRRSVRRLSRRRSVLRSARLRALSIAKKSLQRASAFGCKKGEIIKKGYTTKRGVRVSPTCIKDKGAKGKGPKVIPSLKKGTMMGYSTKLSQKERKIILKKIMKKTDYSTLIKKLNAIRTLLKRTSPIASKTIDSDIIYIQKKYKM